jgi:hypothetical protein
MLKRLTIYVFARSYELILVICSETRSPDGVSVEALDSPVGGDKKRRKMHGFAGRQCVVPFEGVPADTIRSTEHPLWQRCVAIDCSGFGNQWNVSLLSKKFEFRVNIEDSATPEECGSLFISSEFVKEFWYEASLYSYIE